MILGAEDKNIKYAANLFIKGNIIIYPTDTLYGLGVDATNTFAINKLNKLKNRIAPLSIIVSSIPMMKKYVKISRINLIIIKKILPGAFTFLLEKKKSNLSDKISLGTGNIAVRIPESKFILDVVNYINKPIVTTSLNLHGETPINNFDILKTFYDSFNIFKGKTNKNSIGSTIIDLTTTKPKVIRQGDGLYN